MGTTTTYDFLSKNSKRLIDESKGLLREREALNDITNAARDDPDYLPGTNSIAVDRMPAGKKRRLMNPVGLTDADESTARPHGKTSMWTPTEDRALRLAVDVHHGRNWKLIAAAVPTRTDVQCLHRWQKVLNPILVKGYWTKEEDERMIELVQMFGMKRWAAIARCLPGRNGKQCRERWCNHLDPTISREAWSEAEDMVLFLAHSSYGNKWAEISKLLPGRSDNGIKNRWNTSVKKKAKQLEQYTKFLNLDPNSTESEEARRPDVRSPALPTSTNLDARRPDVRSPALPTSTNLDGRRPDVRSPVLPTSTNLDGRRPDVRSPVLPNSTNLDGRRPDLRSPVLPTATNVDSRRSDLRSPRMRTATNLDARRPELRSLNIPTATNVDAWISELRSPVLPTATNIDSRRSDLRSPRMRTATNLDARRPELRSLNIPTATNVDAWRSELKSPVLPTATNLDARRPNLRSPVLRPATNLDGGRSDMVRGGDRNASQPGQKENCEPSQGFKSYVKVGNRASPPGSRREQQMTDSTTVPEGSQTRRTSLHPSKAMNVRGILRCVRARRQKSSISLH